MARAAEFSPWLVRWREPRAINTCRPSWMRGCRVYIQAGFRNFLPVSVTYADQRPPICQTWNVDLCTYGNAMRNCDSLSSFSCSRFMKRHYLEIDERFPKLDAFADNAVSLVLTNSRISSRINSPQVRSVRDLIRFELCFFLELEVYRVKKVIFFRFFGRIKVRTMWGIWIYFELRSIDSFRIKSVKCGFLRVIWINL